MKRVKDCILALALVLAVAIPAHYWITDRLGVLRVLYPAQALASNLSLSCSPQAPAWMSHVVEYVTENNGSPANQLAYIDPKGDIHNCRNGWQGATFRSSPVDDETRFRYASLTKLLTADAILMLIDGGSLALNSRLTEVLGNVPQPEDDRVNDITIEMLLRHQAGFDRLQTPDPLFEMNGHPWCPYDLEELAEMELDYAPGERQSYSNVGYCLLGVVLEEVSGKTYQDYIMSAYPLAEQDIQFLEGPYLPDEVASDYRNSNFYSETYHRYFDFNALASSAGLSGNATGFALILQSIIGREGTTLLSAPMSAGCVPSEHRECYGYAFYQYQNAIDFHLYIQPGFLPGSNPVAVVDSEGGVTVLLTSGAALERGRASQALYNKMYELLKGFYEA